MSWRRLKRHSLQSRSGGRASCLEIVHCATKIDRDIEEVRSMCRACLFCWQSRTQFAVGESPGLVAIAAGWVYILCHGPILVCLRGSHRLR